MNKKQCKRLNLLLIILAMNCAASKEQQKQAVEDILRDDLILKAVTLNDLKNKKYVTNAFQSHVSKMMEFEDQYRGKLPKEFRDNYIAHRYAYEDAVKKMQEKEKEILTNLFKSFLATNPLSIVANVIKNTIELNTKLNERGMDTTV